MPSGTRGSVMKIQHYHHPQQIKYVKVRELLIGSSRCVLTGSLCQSCCRAWGSPNPGTQGEEDVKKKKKSILFTKLGHELMVRTVEFYGKTSGC